MNKSLIIVFAAASLLTGCTTESIVSTAEANGQKTPLNLNINPQRLFVIQEYSNKIRRDRQPWVENFQAQFRQCGFPVAFGTIAKPETETLILDSPPSNAGLEGQIQAFQPDYILEIAERHYMRDARGPVHWVTGIEDDILSIDYRIQLMTAQQSVVWQADGFEGKPFYRSFRDLSPEAIISRMKQDGIFTSCRTKG